MAFNTRLPRPPYGSTDWGARQFYRLLEDEERIATERGRRHAGKARIPDLPPERQITLAGYSLPQPGSPGRPIPPRYLEFFGHVPETTPANTNVPPNSLGRTVAEPSSSVSGEIPRPTFMNGSLWAEQDWEDQERALRHYYALLAREMRLEERARNRERALELLKARKASEVVLQGEHPSAESVGDAWLSEIGAWIPFISRDIPEDDEDDYCYHRYEAEKRRCQRWPWKWHHGCIQRASDRFRLCVRNGGQPDPDEPFEWNESDMEVWYNPNR